MEQGEGTARGRSGLEHGGRPGLSESAPDLVHVVTGHAGVDKLGHELPGVGNAQIVEKIFELLFQVASGEGVEWLGCGTLAGNELRRLLVGEEVDARPGQCRQLHGEVAEGGSQLIGTPAYGCRRVVQLVGEARRKGAELSHALRLSMAGLVLPPSQQHQLEQAS